MQRQHYSNDFNKRRLRGERMISDEDDVINQDTWTESDSTLFLRYGRTLIPERDEMEKIFLDLIPATLDDDFIAVDMATGSGWLTEAIIRHYPKAYVIALDGSHEMLATTKKRLQPYANRLEFRPFDLFDDVWMQELPEQVTCFVSSLAVHHLDLDQKQHLFKKLYQRLWEDGALLIADIVRPANESGKRSMSRQWDETTKKQSALEGNMDAYEFFLNEKWNLFEYPDDPVDKPSTLLEQLEALREAGYTEVDTWWAKAGHALFGGYKK